jgi:hypothetical protein
MSCHRPACPSCYKCGNCWPAGESYHLLCDSCYMSVDADRGDSIHIRALIGESGAGIGRCADRYTTPTKHGRRSFGQRAASVYILWLRRRQISSICWNCFGAMILRS